MHFIWPEVLWLLLLIPLLVVGYIWALRRKRTLAVHYPSLDLIRPALGPGHRIRRHIPPALLLCAFSLVLLGAARPSARVTLPADYLTLVLAMDVSRSMLAEDVPPSRIVAAQQAAKSFLQELPTHVRVAVVSFAGNAQLVQGVTDQKDVLLAAIDSFQLQRGTATGSGLLVALNTLLPESAIDLETMLYGAEFKSGILSPQGGAAAGRSLDQRSAPEASEVAKPAPVGSYTAGAVILLSDGRRTTGPDPVEVAKWAASKGVRVYTVAFGTPNGFIPGLEGFSFYARVDEEALQKVAETTGAEFFRATNATDLASIYQHLSSKFTLERRDTEITALLAAAAAILVLLALGLSMRWYRR
ncbi:VWA domain-containing protein [Limnohabitans sp.]|jgi:Ca-activated chloride channel family protein|uniref:VWA domain-containing protein n=1 Tax=Limnohabitans sp. TaxID=1907725 RepID=UPI0037BEBA82